MAELEDEAIVCPLGTFCQRAAEIMREIGDTGQPVFITERGRFIAVIQPLEPGQVESRVLTEMAREIQRGNGDG